MSKRAPNRNATRKPRPSAAPKQAPELRASVVRQTPIYAAVCTDLGWVPPAPTPPKYQLPPPTIDPTRRGRPVVMAPAAEEYDRAR